MTEAFINLRFLDILDILLVAFLIYELYLLIKGTAAFNIILGIFIFYITWIIVRALNMELMGSIMGQVMGVGVLALIVVFQQEIRKLFLLLGTRYNLNNKFSFETLFSREKEEDNDYHVKEIVMACDAMSRSKTGALIVLVNKTELQEFVDTGEQIDSRMSGPLLQTIFFKNSPLHDGAVIINKGKIIAARCVLPVSSKRLKNDRLGLRHRAALGISQATDAQVIIVSEETGKLSYAYNGTLHENLNPVNLIRIIEKVYEKQNR
ncbi:MAG: diadenylate cyclase CdaA [Prolixibacteraceae bacterium]|nr:diadenylate cyclase CdaA [Prolixibacteraceae bacterium]